MTDTRPLLLVDVDGVLNPGLRCSPPYCSCHPRWIRTRALGFRLYLNPAHGPALLKVAAETGAELAWGSTWQGDANKFIAPWVGLPELPFVPLRGLVKAASVVPWTAGRPFAWLDDDDTELDAAAALALQAGQRFLPVRVQYRTGLQDVHLAEARDWLLSL